MRRHHEKTDSQGQRHAQRQKKAPARKLFVIRFRRNRGRTVQRPDAVDQRLDQNGKTAQERLTQHRIVRKAEPRAALHGNVAVRLAQGNRGAAAVAHPHAVQDGLAPDQRRGGKEKGQEGLTPVRPAAGPAAIRSGGVSISLFCHIQNSLKAVRLPPECKTLPARFVSRDRSQENMVFRRNDPHTSPAGLHEKLQTPSPVENASPRTCRSPRGGDERPHAQTAAATC